jgi:hypothetical protein
LRKAGANLDDACIPGIRDLSLNFCDPMEYLGEDFVMPCHEEQQLFLRRNRNLFSSGEDNLVLRGVNLYGEKQWILIADRYLPDRSVNIISQRYSKLCVMLYKAHGIDIDPKGNLIQPPKLESVDDIDETKVTKLGLSTVEPPAILNVHRWSLEEDLTLLKAVPLMGHMWAELGARLIPHRDRGHLRKRYQVLERRVKATVTRSTKMEIPKNRNPTPVRKTPVPVKPALLLKTSKPFSVSVKPPALAVAKKQALVKAASSKPPMSIEKAAASLAFLRPPRPVVPVPVAVSAADTAKPSAVVAKAAAAAAQIVASHPGASIPASKLLPKGPAKRTLVKGPESHLCADASESRTAFEQLVEGTSEEWSQMSRMKKMLESDAESHLVLVADAISQMAKTPTNPDAIKLPQMHLDTNSLSGLSVLQPDASKPAASLPKGPNSGISIMASVMERTSKSNESSSNNNSNKESDSKMLAPSNKETPKKFSMESPRKRMPSRSAAPSTPTLTPKGGKSNFFSMGGTPIGLSPGFRMSPNMRTNALSLTPNVTYSSAPNSVMRFMNDGNSGDGFEFCNFEISEESRQQMDVNGKAGSQADPTPPPLTPSKNSLMFGEQTLMGGDFDAISALQSLSNSPARGLLTRKQPEEPASSKSEKKSLFAKVVGGIKEKDPSKKKLQF